MSEGKLRILEQGGEAGQTAALAPRGKPGARGTKNASRLERRLGEKSARALVVLVAGALPGDQLADGRAGARDRLLVGFDFRPRGLLADGPDAETYFLLFRIHLDDLEVVFHARLQVQRRAVLVGRLGFVAEAFDSFRDFHECTEGSHAQDFAAYDIANVVCREKSLPDIGLKLLHTQREPPLLGLDCQHHGLDAIALLQYFRRMLHALGPAQVADVNQAVDAVFDLDESTEVGQIANPTLDSHADRELLMQRIPRVGGELTHAERNAPLGRVHVEHDAFDLI